MPAAQLNFGNQQATGDQQLAGASPYAYNVLVDGAGAIRRRPGLSAWDGFPDEVPEVARVDGMHSFEGDLYYVTEGRKIWQISDGDAANFSLSGADSFLAGTERPVFAETQFRLVIAGGLAPSKVESAATQAALLGGSPPNSRQVAALASRLFTDDRAGAETRGNIRRSRTGSAGNETWQALEKSTAEARPDAIVALRENSNELYVFGETTLQAFSPDPTIVLAPGRAVNRGCAAAHSVIRVDESFAWLDEQRQFVVSDGRTMDVVSDPIASVLDGIDTVSDCWGFRLNIDQFDCLVWTFPTDGRTFCYQRGGGWSQWSGFSGGHTLYPAKAHHYWPSENLHLIGLSSGEIVQADASAPTDMGATIKAEVTTGFTNHGTDAMKFTDSLRLTFKRGSSASTEPHVLLSWRDNLGAFGNPRRIGLGTTGDYVFTRELRSLGGYRRRQWRIEFTGSADFVFAGAEETFSIGSN